MCVCVLLLCVMFVCVLCVCVPFLVFLMLLLLTRTHPQTHTTHTHNTHTHTHMAGRPRRFASCEKRIDTRTQYTHTWTLRHILREPRIFCELKQTLSSKHWALTHTSTHQRERKRARAREREREREKDRSIFLSFFLGGFTGLPADELTLTRHTNRESQRVLWAHRLPRRPTAGWPRERLLWRPPGKVLILMLSVTILLVSPY